MAKLAVVVGQITRERTVDNTKFQAAVRHYLGERAWIDLPDPETGQVVKTELTDIQKLDLYLEMLIEHTVRRATANMRAAKAREQEAQVEAEAEAIKM